MRTVATLTRANCKISIFSWNEKYIVKIEQGMLEQTYKMSEWDVSSEEDVKKLLDEPFMATILKQFEAMDLALFEAIERL